MKRLILVLAILFLLPAFISAHPGRTDKDGCHVCRTNCEKWGVPRGEKHCHKKKSAPTPISGIKTKKNAGTQEKVKVHGWNPEKKELVDKSKKSQD